MMSSHGLGNAFGKTLQANYKFKLRPWCKVKAIYQQYPETRQLLSARAHLRWTGAKWKHFLWCTFQNVLGNDENGTLWVTDSNQHKVEKPGSVPIAWTTCSISVLSRVPTFLELGLCKQTNNNPSGTDKSLWVTKQIPAHTLQFFFHCLFFRQPRW